MVEKYKQDYPQEYKDFKEGIELRRKMINDGEYGTFTGITEMRSPLSIPEKLMNVFEYTLKEEPMFSKKGELKWFIKKYPEFSLGHSY